MTDKKNSPFILVDPETRFEIDFSGMNISMEDLEELKEKIKKADLEMRKIEAGEIKNPDACEKF